MAPINYQHQQDRHLEDGLAAYGDEKAALKGQTSSQTPDQPQKPKFRIMNPRRFTVTFGLGLLVGFGLISASRSRPHRSLCSGEIHASNEHEMKALVEQTKDDTSALSDILRCASPETFHRLVGVYFPERNKPEADSGRAEAIGTDETWLLTAWDKLVKRQDEGAGDAATPSDSATDNGAGIVTETTTVTNAAPTSSDPPVQDSTTTDPGSDPVSTTTETLPDTSTEESTTSVEVPPTSSTSEELPESTTEALPTTSSTAPEETSSSEEPVESSTQPATETTSSSSQAEPESSTSEEVPPPPSSTSTSSSEPAPTAPQKTTTSDEEPDRPSKTTIHMGSSAVKETITSTREDGGTTTITSTSWVAVDPPEQTDESESDPSLQDAGLSLRANVGPVLFVGGLVTMLLMA